MIDDTPEAQAIARANDAARKSMRNSLDLHVALTKSVADLEADDRLAVIRAVQNFDAFTPANDPHGEHDYATFEVQMVDGSKHSFFFKFDYYDKSMREGSPDPADENVTMRVLTIGFNFDY